MTAAWPGMAWKIRKPAPWGAFWRSRAFWLAAQSLSNVIKHSLIPLQTASNSGPGPLILMFLSITSSKPVRRIVWPLSAGSKSIVSPSLASVSAWRSEPGPLSFVLITVIVFARAGVAIAQSSSTQAAAKRIRITLAFTWTPDSPILTKSWWFSRAKAEMKFRST